MFLLSGYVAYYKKSFKEGRLLWWLYHCVLRALQKMYNPDVNNSSVTDYTNYVSFCPEGVLTFEQDIYRPRKSKIQGRIKF